MLPYMQHFGNPSSSHVYGKQVSSSRCCSEGARHACPDHRACPATEGLPPRRVMAAPASPFLALQTRAAVDLARRQVAQLVNAAPEEIFFTSW